MFRARSRHDRRHDAYPQLPECLRRRASRSWPTSIWTIPRRRTDCRAGPESSTDRHRHPWPGNPALRTGSYGAARPSISRAQGDVPGRSRHHVRPAMGPRRRKSDQSRRRRTPSPPPFGIEGLHAAGHLAAALDGHRRHLRTRWTPDGPRALRRGDRHRASIPDPDYLRATRRTGRGLGAVLGMDRRHLQGLQLERRR